MRRNRKKKRKRFKCTQNKKKTKDLTNNNETI